MAIILNGSTGITTPDIDSTAAPDFNGSNITNITGTNITNIPAAQLTGALPAISGASLTGIDTEPFKYVAATGATPTLSVGTYNFFDGGTLTANTTVSFSSVPATAKWQYSFKVGTASGSWDISTAVYLQVKGTSDMGTDDYGLSFKTDGTKMYTVGKQYDDILLTYSVHLSTISLEG